MTVRFTLNSGALRRRDKLFSKAQSYIDSECIRLMRPLVPVGKPYFRHSGKLRDSAGNPSPGVIVYLAQFARHDYYAAVNHRHGGNPNAQRMWFEVMKRKHAAEILRGVRGITGGKT